jgi:hypothetical protein
MPKTLTMVERFDKVDAQLATINSQLDKIASVAVKGFDRIDKGLETKANKDDIRKLYDLMDKIAKQQEIDDDERLVMGHQLERLDRWVHEVADKIGYKLTT